MAGHLSGKAEAEPWHYLVLEPGTGPALDHHLYADAQS